MSKYLTLTDVENYLGITFSEDTNPSILQVEKFIETAEREFDKDVGDYSEATTTEIVDGAHICVYVSRKPVTSINAVYVNVGTIFEPEWKQLDPTDYIINDAELGQIYIDGIKPGEKLYKIEYTAGYSYDNMPEEIKYCVFLITMKYIFQNTLFNTMGAYNEQEQIIDATVYKSVTKGGNPYNGTLAIEDLIDKHKKLLINKLKTYLI